ncbi:MAG: hypothetical protein WCW26_00190 [Candidatus Buchananbacteria bacterium]
MKNKDFYINLGIWLIVAVITFFYIKFFTQMQSIGDAIVAASPALIFFAGGIYIFTRDQKIIKKTKATPNFIQTVNLNWGQAMTHDILIYLVPIIILALPLFFGEKPALTNIFQAISAFLALTYLKFIYWDEI